MDCIQCTHNRGTSLYTTHLCLITHEPSSDMSSDPLPPAYHHDSQASHTIPTYRVQKIYTKAILTRPGTHPDNHNPKPHNSISIMGCAESRVSGGHDSHHHPSSSYYDWDEKDRGYTPYQTQGRHRRRWHQEDNEAQQVRNAAERERNRQALKHYNPDAEKAKMKTSHKEYMGRKRADAYGQQLRDLTERERNCEALKFYDVHEKRGNLRRPRDEEASRKRAAGGKREKIRVYASPEVTSRWSRWS